MHVYVHGASTCGVYVCGCVYAEERGGGRGSTLMSPPPPSLSVCLRVCMYYAVKSLFRRGLT